MSRNPLRGLEDVGVQITKLNVDIETSDTDSLSLASGSTQATSMLPIAQEHIHMEGKSGPHGLSGEKIGNGAARLDHSLLKPSENTLSAVLLRKKINSVRDRLDNSALVLECLQDMVAQENDLLEASMARFCEELSESIAANTHTISKASLFPLANT